LLAAKKFISRVIEDNSHRRHEVTEVRIRYEIRLKDQPGTVLYLQYFARQEQPALPAVPKPTPGISLLWKGRRIRGVSRRIKHDVIRDGIKTGVICGWYEHQWTNTDEDRYIVDINNFVKNPDFSFTYLSSVSLNSARVGGLTPCVTGRGRTHLNNNLAKFARRAPVDPIVFTFLPRSHLFPFPSLISSTDQHAVVTFTLPFTLVTLLGITCKLRDSSPLGIAPHTDHDPT